MAIRKPNKIVYECQCCNDLTNFQRDSGVPEPPHSELPPPTCSASHIQSLNNLSGSPASQPLSSPASQPVTSPLSDIDSFHSDCASPNSSLASNKSSSEPLENTSRTRKPVVRSPDAAPSAAVDPIVKNIKEEVCEDKLVNEEKTNQIPKDSVPDVKETYEMPIHPIVQILLDCDPPVRMTNHVALEVETEESLMTSFVKLADTELVDVITWAKSVPGIT